MFPFQLQYSIGNHLWLLWYFWQLYSKSQAMVPNNFHQLLFATSVIFLSSSLTVLQNCRRARNQIVYIMVFEWIPHSYFNGVGIHNWTTHLPLANTINCLITHKCAPDWSSSTTLSTPQPILQGRAHNESMQRQTTVKTNVYTSKLGWLLLILDSVLCPNRVSTGDSSVSYSWRDQL